MIVVALIAIFTGIAAPSFQEYIQRTNLKSAARGIASDIYLSKTRAISENRYYKISFDTSGATYKIRQGDSSGSSYSDFPNKGLYVFGDGLSFSSSTFTGNEIEFQPRGTCSQGNIILSNNKGFKATIAITVTGRTYVSYS